MGCYQTDAAVGAECQRTSAGSDVRACLCWYAESCCIKLSQGCFRWWWRGFHCNGTETPPFLFTASPPHVHVRYPLSFTCVSSSRHPASLSGVQGWVSPPSSTSHQVFEDRSWFHSCVIPLTWMLLWRLRRTHKGLENVTSDRSRY